MNVDNILSPRLGTIGWLGSSLYQLTGWEKCPPLNQGFSIGADFASQVTWGNVWGHFHCHKLWLLLASVG